MEKEEQLLRKRIQELADLAYERDIPISTDFLNLNEQTVFQNIAGTLPPVRYELTGGFLTSERKTVCFLPSYEETLTEPPFVCIRIAPANRKFSEDLTHRDYLGALMNLGIERAVIGDIVVKPPEAYVFVMRKIGGYICENLTTIRHTTIHAEVFDGGEIQIEPEYEVLEGSVSSLRLDSLAALAGRLSRTKAAELIVAEKVFLNGRAELSCSRLVKEGEILSIRGVGKFRFDHTGGQTKKGRIMVTLLRYQ